jgi:hypothetical protein
MNRIVRLAVLSTLGLSSFALLQQALPSAYSGAASAQMLPADPHAKAAARAAAADKAARMKKSATSGPGMSVLAKDAPGFCTMCHLSQDQARAQRQAAAAARAASARGTRSAKKASALAVQ